ncbi:MAG: hypothetical protein E6G04_06765 [Actinobacteria bacterium]|nr:MAG: hypothetical protein E6G04_06765 [Actinomycetota bacterium]
MMTHTSEASRGLASRARSYAFPVIAFVVWRVVQLAILLSFGGQSALKQTTGFLPISHPGFFLWDGAWYQRIMDVGYRPIAGSSQQPASFFPLLPWTTRAVRFVIRSELGAAILVTTVASFAAVVLVYEVLRRWKGESVARWAIVLLLAFPTSFFLWEFYTEALFIALTAGALLAMMRRAVWLAGILGGLATMARPTGILVLLVLAVMYLEQRRGINRDVLWLVLCACGIGVVMLVMKQQTGSALAFTRGSEAWGRHLTVPWTPVNTTLRAYLHGTGPRLGGWSGSTASALGSVRDVVATYVFLFLFLVSLWRPWPWSARILILTMTLAPMATGIVQSMSRYVLAAWPAFGVAADVPATVRSRVLGVVTLILIALSVAVLHDWSHGYFIA